MSKLSAVTSVIDSVFASTNKNFVCFKAIRELLPKNVKDFDFFTLATTGYRWNTMVISEHGFKQEFQAQYKREAAKNIPKIYYGPGGFDNYDIGGGVCYVLIRK